jgi:hypothetical protein
MKLADDQNQKGEFHNTAKGPHDCDLGRGVDNRQGRRLSGRRRPYHPAQANSDTERRSGIRWFHETLGSGLDDKRTALIVVIELRVYRSDGDLLELGSRRHRVLPVRTRDDLTLCGCPQIDCPVKCSCSKRFG